MTQHGWNNILTIILIFEVIYYCWVLSREKKQLKEIIKLLGESRQLRDKLLPLAWPYLSATQKAIFKWKPKGD